MAPTPSVPTSSFDRFEQLMVSGNELLRQGRVAEAQRLFMAALEVRPGDVRALALLGLAHFRSGHFESARPIYEELVGRHPDDASYRLNLGLVHLKLGDASRAIHELERSRDLDPSQGRAVSYLGLAYARSGRFPDAYQAFLHAGQGDLAREVEQHLTAADKERLSHQVRRVPQPASQSQQFVAVRDPRTTAPTVPPPPGPSSSPAPPDNAHKERPTPPPAPPQVQAPPVSPGPPSSPASTATITTRLTPGRGVPQTGRRLGSGEAPGGTPPAGAPIKRPPTGDPALARPASSGDSARMRTSDSDSAPVRRPPSSDPAPVRPASGGDSARMRTSGSDSAPVRRPPSSDPAPGRPASGGDSGRTPVVSQDAPTRPISGGDSGRIPVPGGEGRPPASTGDAESAGAVRFPRVPTAITRAVAQAEPASAAAGSGTRVAAGARPPQALSEFATARLVRPEDGDFPFEISATGVLIVRVDGKMLSRTEGVDVTGGELVYEPARRRSRGASTSESFDTGGRPMFVVSGKGHLIASPVGGQFTAVHLDDDIFYLREDLVFAFEPHLRWETGHVPGSREHLNMVQFRGTGSVAFRTAQPLLAVKLAPERVLYVDATALAGWIGRVVPRAVTPAGGGQMSELFVECTGEGVVLVQEEIAPPERFASAGPIAADGDSAGHRTQKTANTAGTGETPRGPGVEPEPATERGPNARPTQAAKPGRSGDTS